MGSQQSTGSPHQTGLSVGDIICGAARTSTLTPAAFSNRYPAHATNFLRVANQCEQTEKVYARLELSRERSEVTGLRLTARSTRGANGVTSIQCTEEDVRVPVNLPRTTLQVRNHGWDITGSWNHVGNSDVKYTQLGAEEINSLVRALESCVASRTPVPAQLRLPSQITLGPFGWQTGTPFEVAGPIHSFSVKYGKFVDSISVCGRRIGGGGGGNRTTTFDCSPHGGGNRQLQVNHCQCVDSIYCFGNRGGGGGGVQSELYTIPHGMVLMAIRGYSDYQDGFYVVKSVQFVFTSGH